MSFKRPQQPPRAARVIARTRRLAALLTTKGRAATFDGGTSGEPVEKDAPVRSESYRRLVAALPCIHCRKPGPSQCAHANTGKGMAIKASDLDTFPLCPDCHRAFDQGALFTKEQRREMEPQWIAQTRKELEKERGE